MIQTDFPPYDVLPTLVLSLPQIWGLSLFTSSPGIPPLKRKCDLDCILLSQRPNKYNHNAKCDLDCVLLSQRPNKYSHNATQGKSELRTGRINDYQKKKV